MRFNLITWPMACGALLALSACSGSGAPAGDARSATSSPPDIQPVVNGQPPRERCDAQAAQSFVGQAFGADTLEQARAAASAIEARMLRPDSVVSKEYKVGRLNVVVGADNRITRVHCG